jgi:hypothetical protein
MVTDHRRAERADGEALFSHTRQVRQVGGSLFVNVTKDGERLLGLDANSEAAVHVFEDRVVIKRGGGDGE